MFTFEADLAKIAKYVRSRNRSLAELNCSFFLGDVQRTSKAHRETAVNAKSLRYAEIRKCISDVLLYLRKDNTEQALHAIEQARIICTGQEAEVKEK